MSRWLCWGLLSLGLACWLVACASTEPGETEPPGDGDGDGDGDGGDAGSTPLYPNPDWQTGAPVDHGFDEAGLEAAAEAAERHNSYCLLVIRDGVLVFERYFGGTDRATHNRSWSIAKSYAGTLVGIATERGELGSLDDSVADVLTEWRGTEREAITIRDVVSMTSGLEWSAFSDYGSMVALSSDHTEFALDLGLESEPGTDWIYHNGGVQILEPLLRRATGLSMEAYADAHLWSKIGMGATWARDRAGNPTAYANVMATCRDHARFGLLVLRRGVWADGARVVPESWIESALTPSQEINRGYGHLFWLNGYEPTKSAMNEDKAGTLAPWAPDDLIAARGFGNQFIDVIASLDLVVVRFGADPMSSFDFDALVSDARFDEHAEIVQPILDALE